MTYQQHVPDDDSAPANAIFGERRHASVYRESVGGRSLGAGDRWPSRAATAENWYHDTSADGPPKNPMATDN